MYVAVVFIFVLLIFLVLLLLGRNAHTSQGYDSSEAVIRGYFSGIKTNNSAELQKCYDLRSPTGAEDCKKQLELAQELSKHMTINLDTIKIDKSEYTGNIEDIKRTTGNSSITAVNHSWITFLTEETKSDDKNTVYTRLHVQRFLTYEAKEKWYIYANSESATASLSAVDKKGDSLPFKTESIDLDNTKQIGDDNCGYVKIGSDWLKVDTLIDGDITYESPLNNARITLATIENEYDDISTYASVFEQSLQQSEHFQNLVTVHKTKLANRSAHLVICMDKQSQQLLFTWLFKHPTQNDRICEISFECTPAAVDTISYVSTFTF